ncbi:MAG: WbqC family protein [Bacteroidales bacterium]|nr:WbqC family protein [Bacteroidales bacterium]
MSTAYLTSAYLAPVWYYTKLLSFDKIMVEGFDSYTKQSYRNRCRVAEADGVLSLTIPTEKPDNPKCLMRDVRISDHGHWRHVHWNALVAAYRHSPFFDYYADDFAPFYEHQYTFLWDFNMELCQLVCDLMDLHPDMEATDDYRKTVPNDYRELIHPKNDHRIDSSFLPIPYYQVFREQHGFLPNLSIVDLLFNMGPESLVVLQKSIPSSSVNI